MTPAPVSRTPSAFFIPRSPGRTTPADRRPYRSGAGVVTSSAGQTFVEYLIMLAVLGVALSGFAWLLLKIDRWVLP